MSIPRFGDKTTTAYADTITPMSMCYMLTCPNVRLPPEKYIPPPTNRNQRPMRQKASKKKRGRA